MMLLIPCLSISILVEYMYEQQRYMASDICFVTLAEFAKGLGMKPPGSTIIMLKHGQGNASDKDPLENTMQKTTRRRFHKLT